MHWEDLKNTILKDLQLYSLYYTCYNMPEKGSMTYIPVLLYTFLAAT